MNPVQSRFPRPSLALLTLLVALASTAALAASKPASIDPQVRYQRERAACSVIRDVGDRNNCLSEASARLAGTKPSLAEEAPDILMRNALRRCEPLPESDRKDCVARMNGRGTTSGSVEGGGIYRELVTIEDGVAPPAPAVLPAPAAPAAPK